MPSGSKLPEASKSTPPPKGVPGGGFPMRYNLATTTHMPPTQRPPANEYAPFYHRYLAELPDADVLELMRSQEHVLSKLPAAVPPSAEDFAYAPGKWTVRQVVGHLGDTERVFGYRALRISRGDLTPLPGFEENDYVANSSSASRPLHDLVGELTLLRGANLHLFSTLDPDSWLHVGVANSHPVSVRALAFIIVGHAEHHLRILRDRYHIDC